MKRVILMLLLSCALGSETSSLAWTFAFCNNTNEPVKIESKLAGCFVNPPKIDYLAPRSCVIVDQSESWYAGCCMRAVSFYSAHDNKLIESFPLPRCIDTTYILHEREAQAPCKQSQNKNYCWKTVLGTSIPHGCSVVAVMQNASKAAFLEFLRTVGQTGALEQAVASVPSASGAGFPSLHGDTGGAIALVMGGVALSAALLAAGGFAVYDAYQAAVDSCKRYGKYFVAIPLAYAGGPGVLESLKSQEHCGRACLPHPSVLKIDESRVCGYEIVDDLEKRFPGLWRKA